MLRYLAGGPIRDKPKVQGSTLLHVRMHLHSLSATLLSGVGGGGAGGETEESAERTTLLLHALPCVCLCPFAFPASALQVSRLGLRVLAKKRYNGGGGPRDPRAPFFSGAAAGLWGGGARARRRVARRKGDETSIR